MNRLIAAIVWVVLPCSAAKAQITDVKPSPGDHPPKAFSNRIPKETSWVVTIQSAFEVRKLKSSPSSEGIAQQSGPPSVTKIENSYSSGIRKETFFFSDDRQFTRYVTNKDVIFEHAVTGEPVFEDVKDPTTGSTTGVGELSELGWISNKYFVGSAKYQGRDCYVYREFYPEQYAAESFDDEDAPPPPGAAWTDLKDTSNAKIKGTAFIDKQTMKPIAYETIYESRRYDLNVPYSAFELPESLKLALKTRADVLSRRNQSYNIRR